MCRHNADQFSELIARLLNDGWDWSTTKPTETMLLHWLSLGRAHRLLHRAYEHPFGKYEQYIHVFRGRREYAVTRYDMKTYQIGEWSAWIETTSDKRINLAPLDSTIWI